MLPRVERLVELGREVGPAADLDAGLPVAAETVQARPVESDPQAEGAVAPEFRPEDEARPDADRRRGRGTRRDRQDPAVLRPFDEEVDRLVVAERVDVLEAAVEGGPVERTGRDLDPVRHDVGVDAAARLDAQLGDDGGFVGEEGRVGRLPRRVLLRGDREVAKPLRRGTARGLSAVDRLPEPREPEGRDPLEVGRDEKVPSPKGRDLVLDVQAGQEAGRLPEDPEESLEVVPLRERRRDVDGDDDLGTHLPDDVDGKVPRHAAVDEEPALPLDGREEARDRHARAEGPREVPRAEDDGLSRLDVGGDGPEGDREPVEVANGRGGPRQPADVVPELLPGDEAGRDDELSLREAQLDVDEVERVVLLAAEVAVLPGGVVGEGVLPVDASGAPRPSGPGASRSRRGRRRSTRCSSRRRSRPGSSSPRGPSGRRRARRRGLRPRRGRGRCAGAAARRTRGRDEGSCGRAGRATRTQRTREARASRRRTLTGSSEAQRIDEARAPSR